MNVIAVLIVNVAVIVGAIGVINVAEEFTVSALLEP